MAILNLRRSFDLKLLLIIALIIVSTGHVGRLFAEREYERQAVIGYVLAFAIDGVLAVSLYEIARSSERKRRAFSAVVFALTCAVSSGFNCAYYRQNYPTDPWPLSLALGATAPILAALLAVMRAFGDVERKKSADALELRKFEIEQREQTNRARAVARAEEARAKIALAGGQTTDGEDGHKRTFTDFESALLTGDVSLDMSGAAIARWANVSAATGRRWKRDIQELEGSDG